MNNSYVENTCKAFDKKDITNIKALYTKLAEEIDVNIAKQACETLYQTCFDKIILCCTDSDLDATLQYYAWHFLQLMTCCTSVKEFTAKNESLLPALLKLHQRKVWDDDMRKSLNTISISYIVFMLGNASDTYYNHVSSTGVTKYLLSELSECTLSGEDLLVESILLVINLLLEGPSSCKKQLIDLNFATTLSNLIQHRRHCPEELLKVANLTQQKLLLLTSSDKGFVETFRKGFSIESQQQELFKPMTCYYKHCVNTEYSSFKRCSRCKIAKYCSKECQVKDWKYNHKVLCKPKVSS